MRARLNVNKSVMATFPRRRRRRRRIKREIWCLGALFLFIVYRYTQMEALERPIDYDSAPQLIRLKDQQGRVVSRKSSSLSQFLAATASESASMNMTMTMIEATRGRENIVKILEDAGIVEASVADVLGLPKWDQVTDLYGPSPVIVGLDTCKKFQSQVPLKDRYIGVSGMFNSGTTAFGISLQANCGYPNHLKNYSNDVLTDVNGMLNQVPWAKHKPGNLKYNHTIHPDIIKDHVLPIVLVRDPYYWMHSMCKQGYGARWDHAPDKHCPNLVPNDFDKRRFKRLRNASSVPVWMGRSMKDGVVWDSLIHLWNDWYESYYHVDYPRLMIRFEDVLFHGKEVMDMVCKCAGAQQPSRFTYLVDEAKWDHKHAQNNMVSAMVKYGTDSRRYQNMTREDLEFTHAALNHDLINVFGYQAHPMDQNTADSDSRCFPHNSKAWLEGTTRIGNVPLTGVQADTAINDHPLLEPSNWQPILQQSLCHKQSLLLKNEEVSNEESESAIFAWTVRLIYLAIHHHQHRNALQEALERRKQATEQCVNELLVKGIGSFDYECKQSKFLIGALPSRGLGSVMRIDAVNFMLGGLASNRTVLFVNNVEDLDNVKNRLYPPWQLVSCERKDHQCFYQPISPCVVTKEDLAGAYIVEGGANRELTRLAKHEKHRVIIAAVGSDFVQVPGNVPGYLRDIANTLIDGLPKEDPRIPILRLAAEAILDVDKHNSGDDYNGSESVIKRAILMYVMRPSYEQADKLESIMKDVAPDDFNYSVALGLPIRASDKCIIESECLSFHQHMRIMAQYWKKYNLTQMNVLPRNQMGNILLTSESSSVFDEQKLFMENRTLREGLPFSPRFITNSADVHQGTGRAGARKRQPNTVSANDVMLSALSSLKTQLMARYTVGNCCSNFHNLLFDLLRGGCGIAHDGQAECLQKNENPEFRLCCYPKRDKGRCIRIRGKALARYQNSTTTFP